MYNNILNRLSKIGKAAILSTSLLTNCVIAFSQSIEGYYTYGAELEDRLVNVTLEFPTKTSEYLGIYDLIGDHCGVYYNGGRIDCELDGSSIFLKKTSENTYIGKIRSTYSGEFSDLKIIYDPEKDQIIWEILKPNGQFYFPYDAVFRK